MRVIFTLVPSSPLQLEPPHNFQFEKAIQNHLLNFLSTLLNCSLLITRYGRRPRENTKPTKRRPYLVDLFLNAPLVMEHSFDLRSATRHTAMTPTSISSTGPSSCRSSTTSSATSPRGWSRACWSRTSGRRPMPRPATPASPSSSKEASTWSQTRSLERWKSGLPLHKTNWVWCLKDNSGSWISPPQKKKIAVLKAAKISFNFKKQVKSLINHFIAF